MSAFTLLPAIDLRGGLCVRLERGDPTRQTVFGADPVAMARRWEAAGARMLHVVDLDGAFAGEPLQLAHLAAIARSVALPVQFGGGLRRQEDVRAALAAGAARVVVGTRALEPAFLRALVATWGPERIVAGLDARGDTVAVAGWQASGGLDLQTAAARVSACGVRLALFTQVERDGLLTGPDLPRIRRLLHAGIGVLASGGIASVEDIRTLAGMAPAGLVGAVLGRALYDGGLTLEAALAAAAAAGRDTDVGAPPDSLPGH